MSRLQVFEWHKHFKSDREEVEHDPKSGQPFTTKTAENSYRMNQMERRDHRLTMRMIAEELSLRINADHLGAGAVDVEGVRQHGAQAFVGRPEGTSGQCLLRLAGKDQGRSGVPRPGLHRIRNLGHSI